MPSKTKIAKVADLSDKLNRAKSVVLTDYRGLSVAQISDLRKKVEAVGASYEVTKNTLLSRSLGSKEIPSEALEGPTATLFSFTDEIAPLKALQDFIKTNNLPTVKVGFLGSDLLDATRISELAKLPGREVLLGKLVGSLKGSQYGLVSVLSGNVRKLVYALDAVAKSKS
ncbi:MAG TPA: 50S ribosomal protein L10 [Patescibacteria group bacterium]|nr:50S ribosomal protein L10 [Patescibacteria group bacterium]